MTIPVAPLYPDAFDSETNLYTAHDSLRVTLVEDYLPGQTSITVTGDLTNFPATGIITLTEQQSDPQFRAISFFYNAVDTTNNVFTGLELLPEFTDCAKPKNITHVTQNVISPHHNNLVAALIAIEEFIGVKGTTDTKPLGPTMEGRINFLRRLVLRPRAWFTVSKRIGIAPLTVEFTDLSFRSPSMWCWNFGDSSISGMSGCSVITNTISTLSNISTPSGTAISNVANGTVVKTYYSPGIYDVTLTVSNDFGSDTITIPQYITVRIAAPDPATLDFAPNNLNQSYINGVLSTRSNTLVNVSILDNGEQPGDAVLHYNWDMQDDLPHGDSSQSVASYSIGGVYDIRLKCTTQLGAYRTTIFPGIVNVIEATNLFYMVSPDTSNAITKNFYSYEFGLISETFKLGTRSAQSITRDYTAIQNQPDADIATQEFLRNNGFTPLNNVDSGDKGSALVYWTEGGNPINIRFKQYTGFTDTWADPAGLTTYSRGWNWVGFNGNGKVYFVLGSDPTLSPNNPPNSPTNQNRDVLNLGTLTFASPPLTFTGINYRNGADELMQNVGNGTHGDFSVYRSCWKNHTGYMVRNDGVGPYFRLKSFYRTEGTLTDEFVYIRKLPDMPGSMKLEGQLVALNGGVYFFNNSGEIVVWNDTTNIWAVGQPSAASTPFRSLQDQTVDGYDNIANRLIATTDNNSLAYLSFDYSTQAFIKFNESTLAFSSLGIRPPGEQFLMGVY